MFKRELPFRVKMASGPNCFLSKRAVVRSHSGHGFSRAVLVARLTFRLAVRNRVVGHQFINVALGRLWRSHLTVPARKRTVCLLKSASLVRVILHGLSAAT